MRLHLCKLRIRHGIGLAGCGQGKVQSHALALAVVRAAGVGPHVSELGLAHAKILGPQQGMCLAVQAARDLADHMADESTKAQVNLAFGVHHRAVELGKRLHQLGLALHGEHAVGRKAQRAVKEVEMLLQRGRGFWRQGRQTGHGMNLLDKRIENAHAVGGYTGERAGMDSCEQ